MFNKFRDIQKRNYGVARDYFLKNKNTLVLIEEFASNLIESFVNECKEEIIRDYNEASYLNPFWQNYPPEERGRQPIGDQFPWIEVGEHVIGPKLSRYLEKRFNVLDTGIPSGPDDRYIIQGSEIKSILNITDSVWLFIDIKSVGPRDDQDHSVMSHNQISGDGVWSSTSEGVKNTIMDAVGSRASHDFHCAIPPIYVLSSGIIAPVVTLAVKPVYSMLSLTDTALSGQPISRIDIATIPNGLLLSSKGGYLETHQGLLFPGKDDKGKDPRKLRARISFSHLREIDDWRHKSISMLNP